MTKPTNKISYSNIPLKPNAFTSEKLPTILDILITSNYKPTTNNHTKLYTTKYPKIKPAGA